MTRYDLFRQRIAPVAFGVAIALMARESCNKKEHTRATFVLDFGSAADDVKAVDVDVYEHDEVYSHFHRVALSGSGSVGHSQFMVALPDVDGELRCNIELSSGVRHVVRPFHADDGATITIPVERELR